MKIKLFNKFMALLMAGTMTFTSVPVNAAGTGESTGEVYEQTDAVADTAVEEKGTDETSVGSLAEADLAAEEGSVDAIAADAEENTEEDSAVLNEVGTGTAADEIITEADAEAVAEAAPVDETAAGAAAEEFTYVLMNIPYGEFYEAEGDGAVDAVASATKSKPRALSLAGGSYHVSEAGEDITGIIYPVRLDADEYAALQDMAAAGSIDVIDDDASKEYTVRLRGQDTTVTLTGRENLFEAPSYSFYVLGEEPASCKEMTTDESGAFTFGAATGTAGTVEGLTGTVKLNARHADVEIKLNGVEVPAAAEGGDPVYVSGVVVTDENGSRYGLRHVKELWRNTEIGWNYDDARLGGLTGTTITNVRYYFSNGTITDYPCEIAYKVAKYNEDPVNHALIQADDQTPDQLSTYLTAITSVTVNGTEYNNSETPIIRTADAKDEEGNVTVAAGTIDLNAEADGKQIFDGTAEYELTVHATAHDDYTFTLVAPKIVSGGNPSRKDNENKELTVKTDANIDYFRGVKVNGASLAEGQYSLAEDETAVTFANSYLKTLAVGKYKVEIVSANGAAETTLTIQSSKVAVKGVRLNKSAAKVEKGRSLQLKATVTPTNATEKAVTWKSSNASVASVDRNGKVTAKKAGTAKITVTTKDGRKTAVCTVTVYEKIALYRFYNRRTGDHMYTVSATERLRLIASGWKAEGITCYVPKKSLTPVYRLYNRSSGDHMFTRSEAERQAMISAGWKYEGIGFYSDSDKKVPVYRLYNPNAVSGAHFFTASKAERDNLIKAGWKDEKLGFFGI